MRGVTVPSPGSVIQFKEPEPAMRQIVRRGLVRIEGLPERRLGIGDQIVDQALIKFARLAAKLSTCSRTQMNRL